MSEEPADDGADEAAGTPSEEGAEAESIPEEERAPLSSLRERLEARDDASVDEDAPLSELAAETQGTTDAERSELFEEVDVGEVDGEAVWEAVVEAGEPPDEHLGEPEEPSAAEPTGQPDEHVVDKREYCQRCPFFSEPPDVSCTNEGTEIVEMPDNDTFLVRNCPKVGEDDEALRSMISDEQP
jgi:hypothetical protein